MAATTDLQILLQAKDEASKVLKQAEANVTSSSNGMSGAMEKIGGAAKFAALGLAAIGASAVTMGIDFAKQAADEQAGMVRLQQAVKNTGQEWSTELNAAIEENIATMERSTAFSDGEMRDALAGLVAITGDADDATNRLSIATDFARGAHIDLATASKLLGKVTDENVGVLKRYGITVEKGADSTDLLMKVQAKYAGQAKAYAETAQGQWEIFNNQLDNLKEDIGSALLPALVDLAKGAIKAIDDIRNGPLPGMIATLGHVKDVVLEVLGVLTGTASDAGAAMTESLGAPKAKEIMAAIAEVRETVKIGLEAVQAYIRLASAEIDFLKEHWEAIAPVVNNVISQFTTPIRIFIELVKQASAALHALGDMHLSLPSIPSLPSWSLPSFDAGGTVPGAIDSPQLIVAHGGERVQTMEQQAASGIDYDRLGQAIAGALAGANLSVSVDDVHGALLKKAARNGTLAFS